MVGWLGEVPHRYQRQPVNYRHIFNCTEGRRPLLLCCSRVSCIQWQFWTLLWNCCPKFSSVQSLSHVQLCDPMNCNTPGLPVYHQLPELTQTHVHCVGDAIQASRPLLSPSPPALNLSQHQGLFKWVSSSHQVAKILELQLQNQSFRMDWLDLLAVQGTLKSLLQHHSSKASILWHSALFIVQLSHPYMTTGKTIALTRRTFVDKVMSTKLFNMLTNFNVF